MNTPEQTRHERFELRRQLGTGGNGEVWEVFDRERGALVAMKRLLRVDAPSILRFKNEFRGLARISHPNLAQLYELVSDGAEWSFTMELVDGRDFVSAVLSSTPGALRYDDSRLRSALGQLRVRSIQSSRRRDRRARRAACAPP